MGLIVRQLEVGLMGLAARHCADFRITHIRCEGEWLPADLVILERADEGDPCLDAWSSFYWPAVADVLGLKWERFVCVEKNLCGHAGDSRERTMIEVVRFSPQLRIATGRRDDRILVRCQFAVPSGGMASGRPGGPVGPYLASVMVRSGYPVPECYLVGEPPERLDRMSGSGR